ncbi:hypothetical protein Tamer19_07910 [Cupriavidus sp. TA19]|nr:hypothetical protein Tamer19_07910 [Cupriavidus sp. TA19]
MQAAVDHGQAAVRRDDVDLVGLDAGGVADLLHGHGGARLEQRRQLAGVVRGQVRDEDEGSPGTGWQGFEKLVQGSYAASGCAETDHGEGKRAWQGFVTISGHYCMGKWNCAGRKWRNPRARRPPLVRGTQGIGIVVCPGASCHVLS